MKSSSSQRTGRGRPRRRARAGRRTGRGSPARACAGRRAASPRARGRAWSRRCPARSPARTAGSPRAARSPSATARRPARWGRGSWRSASCRGCSGASAGARRARRGTPGCSRRRSSGGACDAGRCSRVVGVLPVEEVLVEEVPLLALAARDVAVAQQVERDRAGRGLLDADEGERDRQRVRGLRSAGSSAVVCCGWTPMCPSTSLCSFDGRRGRPADRAPASLSLTARPPGAVRPTRALPDCHNGPPRSLGCSREDDDDRLRLPRHHARRLHGRARATTCSAWRSTRTSWRCSGGQVAPFYEPGLTELLARHVASGRLRFTDSYEEAGAFGEIHFLCLGTPQRATGWAPTPARSSTPSPTWPRTSPARRPVVGKSTVPVGTAARMADLLASLAPAGRRRRAGVEPGVPARGARGRGHPAPRPDRARRPLGAGREARCASSTRPSSTTACRSWSPTTPTAELVKVTANSFLATKISFINAVAEVCEAAGADVVALADAIGYDDRIGRKMLDAGVGSAAAACPRTSARSSTAPASSASRTLMTPARRGRRHQPAPARAGRPDRRGDGRRPAGRRPDRGLGGGVQARHRRRPRLPCARDRRPAAPARRAGHRLRPEGRRDRPGGVPHACAYADDAGRGLPRRRPGHAHDRVAGVPRGRPRRRLRRGRPPAGCSTAATSSTSPPGAPPAGPPAASAAPDVSWSRKAR